MSLNDLEVLFQLFETSANSTEAFGCFYVIIGV